MFIVHSQEGNEMYGPFLSKKEAKNYAFKENVKKYNLNKEEQELLEDQLLDLSCEAYCWLELIDPKLESSNK